MFSTLKYRRHIAVLAALAMVASVLVAAPAVAADDPEPSLEATFSACVSVPESDFEDVPAGNANAGDIDCIAYYGITKGTSATTYSPRMAVTREHMALFLTRLAGLLDIEVTSTPDNPGFTDTGDLSANSQTAIAQLADLGITKGTSDTTYSPGDSVTRGQMALFISKLMDQMTPYGGDKSTDAHTPSDVADLDSDNVGSPFTDLGSATKSAYDAITALYELGVASGISDTAYAPSALITRAAMAEFMTGVMAHSNLRPAGVSIQTDTSSSFGANKGNIVVSVRDDSFAPVADQVVDIFAGDFDEDGACDPACVWNDGNAEELTDESGNIVADGGAEEGDDATYYAWIGSEYDEEFDKDDTDHVSVTVVSKNAEEGMKVSTSINKNAARTAADADDGASITADLDKGGSVTVTIQLVDGPETADNAGGTGDPVARSGIEITVGVTRSTDPDSNGTDQTDVVYNSTDVATLTTDADGKATYVVDAPEDDDDEDDVQLRAADPDADPPITAIPAVSELENREDLLTFTYKDGGAGLNGASAEVQITISWEEDNPVTTSASSSAPDYVVPDKDGDVAITASVTLYDQYGNGIREAGTGQQVEIQIGAAAVSPATDNVNVNRNGTATRRKVIDDDDNAPGTAIEIIIDEEPDTNDDVGDIETADEADHPMVQVVTNANDDDVGDAVVNSIDTDDGEFLANDTVTATTSNLLFSYDADDTFVNSVPNGETEGELLTMEKFEEMLGDGLDLSVTDSQRATVDVVVYDTDGSSIFRVTLAAREGPAN